MRFRVRVQLNFVDGSARDLAPFTVLAYRKESLREMITPDWIMENISDDWGPPIRSVRIIQAEAVQTS